MRQTRHIRSFPLGVHPWISGSKDRPSTLRQLGSPRLTSLHGTCSTIVHGWEPSLDSGRHGWSPEAAPWRNEQIRRRHFWRWNPTRWGPDVPRVTRHPRALPALLFDEYAYPWFALYVPLSWTPPSRLARILRIVFANVVGSRSWRFEDRLYRGLWELAILKN